MPSLLTRLTVFATALGVLLAVSGTAFGAGGVQPLDMYEATVDSRTAAKLAREGYDLGHGIERVAGGVHLELVLTERQRDRLRGQGIDAKPIRNGNGQTVREQAEAMAAAGYQVYRSYDEAGGIRDELYSLAQRNPNLVKLVVLGRTVQGREIIALKVTRNARQLADGSRPDVLYMGTIHAREWIATEVTRRLLHYYLDNYRKDPAVKNLLDTRELWFMPVANPDGYQYTFDVERLWRKNLRDNNGDGQITVGDGVDLNRNYDERWNYDNEGSSSEFSSDTYRGPSAASEPETQAHQALIDRLKFKFLVTYHSYGQLLLYPYGWQMTTPSLDDPLFLAYSGTDAQPAIAGFDPGVGADLYTTNGTTDDYSYSKTGALSWTPELSEGCDNCGFVFPDDEALVEAEFQRNLPFALDLAKSAPDPSAPVSHLGSTVKDFYLDTSAIDPEKSGNPLSDFRFSVSYGDPQPVQVLAKRSLGAVTLRYQVNGGPEHAVDHVGVGRRRALRQRRRLLLPPGPWERDRHVARRLGEGLVRGCGQPRSQERIVHVHREDRVERPRARARGRGLHGHLARLQATGPALSLVLPRRAGCERCRRRRIRRRRERPHVTERSRRPEPLRRRRSGTRATT